MRFIAPLLVAILGGLLGWVVNMIIKPSELGEQYSAAIGAVAAFFGLVAFTWLEFVFTGDRIADALITSLLAALVVSVAANLLMIRKSQ